MATLREDGRYQERQRVGNGQRIAGYGATPEEARADLERKVQKWREERSTPSTPDAPELPAGQVTLQEFAKRTWFPRIVHLKPLTQEAYVSTYTNHVRPYLGHLPLSAIRLTNSQEWINELSAAGKRDRNKERTFEPLGAKKVREARDRLINILDLAVAEGEITANPVRSTTVPRKPPKRKRILTITKALEISEATRGTRLHAPVVLGMVLGLRRGEIAGLRWEDLDRQARTLTVYEQIVQPKGGAVRADVKTETSRRVLPLTTELIDVVDACGNLDHEYVAGWRGMRWIPPDKITSDWEEVRGGFGMPEWTFHDLRHGAASIMRFMKVDLLTIAAILGHSKIDTTLLYADASSEEIEKAVGDVARAFANR